MKICLAMVTSDGSERRFPLDGPRIVVGRHSRCDLQVPVPTVAPRHCEIVVNRGTLTLQDLDSETGTFHNGARVKRAALAANDTVTVGPVTFVVRTDAGAENASVAELKPPARRGSRIVRDG